MDGSLGSRTAALKAPYSDDPGNTGLPQYSPTELIRWPPNAPFSDSNSASTPSAIEPPQWP